MYNISKALINKTHKIKKNRSAITKEIKSMSELIEKKSRFIGYAKRVSSVDEAKAFTKEIAAEHPKANHITYSYVLSSTAKNNDDGEPKGTAGLPIYNVITRRNIQNIIVIVVRYFGGVKLGKGGLIRAYGKTAGLAIDECD